MKKKLFIVVGTSLMLLVGCQEPEKVDLNPNVVIKESTEVIKPSQELKDIPNLRPVQQSTKELTPKEEEAEVKKEKENLQKEFQSINKEVQVEKQIIEEKKSFKATAYKSNDSAEKVIPYEVEIEGDKADAVQLLFDEVNPYQSLALNGYKFNSLGSVLTLDFNDGIYQVQGSAGGLMFMGVVTETLFDFYPDLTRIKFIHNGKEDTELDHVLMNTNITRFDLKVK